MKLQKEDLRGRPSGLEEHTLEEGTGVLVSTSSSSSFRLHDLGRNDFYVRNSVSMS